MSFHLQLVHKNIHEGSSFSSSPHQVLYNQVTESGQRMDPRPSAECPILVLCDCGPHKNNYLLHDCSFTVIFYTAAGDTGESAAASASNFHDTINLARNNETESPSS